MRENPYANKSREELFRMREERKNRKISPRDVPLEDMILGAEAGMIPMEKDMGSTACRSDREPVNSVKPPLSGQSIEVGSMQTRNPSQAASDAHSSVYIQVVLDGTYSFTTVFRAVYQVLEQFAAYIKKAGEQYPGVRLYLGGTLISETKPKMCEYSGGREFTENPEEFMDWVRGLEFQGGSASGYENVNGAIKSAIKSLEVNSPRRANRGLLVFTDSIPKEKFCSFETIEGMKNHGLRFEKIFVGDPGNYAPLFFNVDGDGLPADNQKNESAVYGLDRILSGAGAAMIEKVMDEILEQSSIGG